MNSKFREELVSEIENCQRGALRHPSTPLGNLYLDRKLGLSYALDLYDKHHVEAIDRVRDDLKGENWKRHIKRGRCFECEKKKEVDDDHLCKSCYIMRENNAYIRR